jgi:alpha-D-ribose 1-methylphosphonate 5-triphosphate diphosphatase PhnM
MPGLVELHTDNIERHMMPRPGVDWPPKVAVMAHDGQIAGFGHRAPHDRAKQKNRDRYVKNKVGEAVDSRLIHNSAAPDQIAANHKSEYR